MATKNIQSIFGGGASREQQTAFIGSIHYFPPKTSNLGSNWVKRQGVELSRNTQKNLWDWVVKTQETILTEEQWQAAVTASPIGACSYYSSGDGISTFRTPTTGVGAYIKGIGSTEYTDTQLQGGDTFSTSAAGLSFTGSAVTPTATTTSSFTGTAVAGHTHTRGTMEITGTFPFGEGDSDRITGAFSGKSSYKVSGNGTDASAGGTDFYTTFTASKNWTGSTSSAGGFTPSGSVSSSTSIEDITPEGTISGGSITRPKTEYMEAYIYTGSDITYESAGKVDLQQPVYMTFGTENPNDLFVGVWGLVQHGSLTATTAEPTGVGTGSNTVTVPVPQHNHTATTTSTFAGTAVAGHTHTASSTFTGSSDGHYHYVANVTNNGSVDFDNPLTNAQYINQATNDDYNASYRLKGTSTVASVGKTSPASGVTKGTVSTTVALGGGHTPAGTVASTTTVANSGTANATINVAGRILAIRVWRRLDEVNGFPYINTQTSNVSIATGTSTVLSVYAVLVDSYQWQMQGANDEEGNATWANIEEATSSKLEVTSDVDATKHYRCMFTNSNGTATSATKTVTWTTPE